MRARADRAVKCALILMWVDEWVSELLVHTVRWQSIYHILTARISVADIQVSQR